ncbi:tyrosine-type recombinase/integrase, partial [Longispora fulva]|uniref:tyrosine-type recombinase/integrase n=2 Tax=Bacteria TaxID=2 RepID=UPI00362AA83C
MTEEPDKDYMWLLEREAKAERKKEHLRIEIIHCEEKMEEHKRKMMNNIADTIMVIKKEHPGDTILPHMRGLYKGEDRLSPEVEAICNNFKTKNNQALKRIAKKVGIKKKISNHQARHVFAMKLFLKGVNMHYISLALGHSNIATTDKYRQKLIDDRLHDVTDDFSETFKDL